MSNEMENLRSVYLYEEDRLNSFKAWPFGDDAVCNKSSMAKAGFFWQGTDTDIDIAVCFVCGKELDGWEATDDPWAEHRKHAPQCPLVKMGISEEGEISVEQFIELFRTKVHTIVSDQLSRNSKRLMRILHEEQRKNI